MEKIFIKKNKTQRINEGHLWVFSNELTVLPKLPAGSTVELFDSNGYSYGICFYNPNSLISLRILKTKEEINIDFFNERISRAFNYRKELMSAMNNYRLVYGESDYLPGLIIDKFENNFVLQILSAGMENHKELITNALLEIFPDTSYILSKGNSKHRELEGLSPNDEVLFGSECEIISTSDEGIKLELSLTDSQKTGYYLDQRYNRHYIRNLVSGKTVLDCYTNQGGFALNACFGGASQVTAVDSSASALEMADRNAKLNNFEIDYVKSDVQEFLDYSISNGQKWDIVILDPPAFAKSKRNLLAAETAYIKLNRSGMRLTSAGGYLATSSCSHHISDEHFIEIVRKAASKARKQLKLIFRGTQPHDHPALLSMPETNYLKFYIFKIEEI